MRTSVPAWYTGDSVCAWPVATSHVPLQQSRKKRGAAGRKKQKTLRKKAGQNQDLLLRKLPFQRLVREIAHGCQRCWELLAPPLVPLLQMGSWITCLSAHVIANFFMFHFGAFFFQRQWNLLETFFMSDSSVFRTQHALFGKTWLVVNYALKWLLDISWSLTSVMQPIVFLLTSSM